MYKELDLETVKARATVVITSFRRRLVLAYGLAEIYMSERPLALGGEAGLAALFEKDCPLDPTWEIYSGRPYEDAKALADILFAEGFSDTHVRTTIKHHELIVIISGIPCFKFVRWDALSVSRANTSQGANRGGSPAYVSAHGWFTGTEIKCLPAITQLSRVYQVLHAPDKCSEWAGALASEAELFAILPGSAINPRAQQPPTGMAKKIAQGLMCVLAGWSDTSTQILSDLPAEKIRQRLKKIFGPNVVAKHHDQGISGDFRLARDKYVASQHTGAGHTVVVYNSLEYECLPVEDIEGVFCLRGWAKLRFQAISGKISSEDRRAILEGPGEDAFPRDLYFGNVEVPGVTRKKIIAGDGRLPDYYPVVRGILSDDANSKDDADS